VAEDSMKHDHLNELQLVLYQIQRGHCFEEDEKEEEEEEEDSKD
jgi:hypothetical protein